MWAIGIRKIAQNIGKAATGDMCIIIVRPTREKRQFTSLIKLKRDRAIEDPEIRIVQMPLQPRDVDKTIDFTIPRGVAFLEG